MAGLTFLVLFLVLMALVAVVPTGLRRFHIPGVIAVMMVGMLIGPNGLDVVRHLNVFMGRGYPTAQLYLVIDALGLLGLVFLMALAGMEVDLAIIRTERRAVGWLSALTFFIPGAAGYMTYSWLSPGDQIGALLYASLFASHSVGIVFPVIRELGAVRTRFGVAVLASTVVTDIASLVLLAVCVQMKRHTLAEAVPGSISVFDHIEVATLGPFFFVLFVLCVMAYLAASVYVVPHAGRWLFKRIRAGDDARLTFFLVVVLAVVFAGELIGVSVVVGAFIAGVAMARVNEIHDGGHLLRHKIEGIGYGFIIPFLFLTIGMKTDLGVIVEARENATIVLVTVVALVGSKIGSGWLAMRLSGFDNLKGICAGLMTIPQLSATLAAAAVGLQLGIIDSRFFNAIVVLSVVTTIPVPTLVKLVIIKGRVVFDKIVDVSVAEHVDEVLEEDLL